MEYRILVSSSIDALPAVVNTALSQGWELQAGPFALHANGYYGQAVVRKQKTINDFFQRPQKSPPKEIPVFNEEDSRLFNALKEKRASLAASFGGPVYCVATNKMLYAVVERKPKTLEELGGVAGFGPAKLKMCGQDLVDIVVANS